ncbi:nucleotidyl transferase AbiEii/AbiGii toxin family protein [Paracoccus sp. (in: a-proteobacteria)]|uniref:nucleotidyl transferase AbiEii/AbiGii toxin family protein n=1 Tax=Paracoccus sp. TaxID=267 RepID=UPI003A86C9F9
MADIPKNIAASVRQRLLNLARKEGQAFDVVLVAFGLERLIYRLSVSAHRDRFVLKGGMLVTLWTKDKGRFTRDIDFLSFGAEDEATLKTTIAEILAIDADDGLIFDDASLTAAPIREDQVYGGMRLKTTAYLEKTRIPITIDVGFGDPAHPFAPPKLGR